MLGVRKSEGVREPGAEVVLHLVELRGGVAWDALEEVVGAWDGDGLFGWGRGGEDAGEGFGRGEFVVLAGEEELGLGAGGQELVGVAATGGGDGKAESDEAGDAWVASAGAKADVGAEGKAGEEDRFLVQRVEIVEGGADVVDFAAGFVVFAFGEAGAAEVEAQHRQTEGGERLHRVVDHLVVHGAAEERVWMRDEGGVGGVVCAGVEESFESADGTAEIGDGLQHTYRV